jgi:hypothetical protein
MSYSEHVIHMLVFGTADLLLSRFINVFPAQPPNHMLFYSYPPRHPFFLTHVTESEFIHCALQRNIFHMQTIWRKIRDK